MNQTTLMGRLTKDPETRSDANGNMIVRYTLAVDRRFKKEGQPDADFIPCVAFGKSAEFADKYFYKGIKIAVTGRIQTGSYTNKEGQRVYTTEVVIENQEFCESKGESKPEQKQSPPVGKAPEDGFMSIPDNIDEDLPFA